MAPSFLSTILPTSSASDIVEREALVVNGIIAWAIARAHIAARVVTRWSLLLNLLQLALPQPLSKVRRDQDPCPRQLIEAAMRCSFQIKLVICDAPLSFGVREGPAEPE